MKKLFTIILIGSGILFSGTVEAQFKWGIKGGVNFASIKNLDDLAGVASLEGYTGYHGGLFFGIKLPIVGVQADVVYSLQGQKFEDVATGGESVLEQSYINIPVVAKISLIPLINLQAGLQYGILAKAVVDGAEEFDFGSGTEKVADQFKSGDWSIVFGIGFDVSKLIFEARYNLGVSDLSATSITQTTDGLKNGVFQLSAGIKF